MPPNPPMTATTKSPPRPTAFQPALLLSAIATALLLGGCAVGPDYVRPQLDLPTAYKEQGPWKKAEPGQIDSNQRWWEAYNDSVLNGLIEQANQANQNIRLAEAQYRQAQATAAIAARRGRRPTARPPAAG